MRQEGFSLIGALVAVLILAVLGAASVPSYVARQHTGQDTSAQLDARSLAVAVEACYSRTRTYASCDTAGEIRNPRLRFGFGPGEVSVTDAVQDDFVITARSRSGNAFKITRTDGGPLVRSCSTARRGGCAAGGRW